jgi:DNA polymerase III delta prime subunit
MNQNDLGDQPSSQQQSLGDVQLQGDGNVFNTVQGKDVQVINLTVYDRIPERVVQLPISTAKSSNQKDYRFRKVLLNKVKNYWVQDVLEKSLHARVLIEFGLEERLDAVKDSFKHFQLIPEASKRSLLETKNVAEVFHKMGEGRTLLILGEPGAGKTITLLRLAKDLIVRTQEDMSQPLPVVLNLSSWALKQKPISVWLVEELSSKYQVSKHLGKAWVADQQLLLLLDGLDEVKAERREACIQSLNQFMQDYGQTEIVVCSRWQDYESLSKRLQLQAAIYIQSLSSEQVNQYLEQTGDQLKALKFILQKDTTLQELAKSPLMLSVMSLVYQNKSVEELPRSGSVEESRQHLFDTYIKQMLRRRGVNKPYPDAKMIHWLARLAQQMERESQTIFLIERMQTTWLENKNHRLIYRIGILLVSGLVGGSISLVSGLLSGGLASDLSYNLSLGLRWGIINALGGGLFGALFLGLSKEEIITVETLKLSWSTLAESLANRQTIFIGLISSLIGGMSLGLCSWLTSQRISGLILGLTWGLIFGLFLGLTFGLKGSEIETRTIPNQGIWISARKASYIGVSFGLAGMVSGLLGLELIEKLNYQILNNVDKLIGGLSVGLSFGLLGVLLNDAGKACLKHFTLRLVLCFYNYVPWKCSKFLDYAAECIFLQKVGGGYIFIHRELMNYFNEIIVQK